MATLSGEFKNARWDAFASPNLCNRKVKHAEGISKCFSEILTDNIGEANFTTAIVSLSSGQMGMRILEENGVSHSHIPLSPEFPTDTRKTQSPVEVFMTPNLDSVG